MSIFTGNSLASQNSYGLLDKKPPGLETQQQGKIQPIGPSSLQRVLTSFKGLIEAMEPGQLIPLPRQGQARADKKIPGAFSSRS